MEQPPALSDPGVAPLSAPVYYTGPGFRQVNPWKPYKGCPRAQTLIRQDHLTDTAAIIPIRCKCWSCAYCAPINAEKIYKKVLSGTPTRFITLTVKPEHDETAKQAHDRCRTQISRLFAKIRQKWGPLEAAVLLEVHKSGYPHWHIVGRIPYVPQSWLSSEWCRLTGSWIVDIRKIRDAREACRYVTKYVIKNAQHVASLKLGRVVSFTRGYLIKEQTNPQPPHIIWTRQKTHPLNTLEDWPTVRKIQYEEGVWWLGNNEGIVSIPPDIHCPAILQAKGNSANPQTPAASEI